jgi:EmrB/QacA subfamily drug resistance transporter
VLLVACVAQFMLILDDTIVNVALPTLGTDLGFSERDLSWVVNAYFLTFGGLLLVGGRVADRVGPRRMFAVSLAAFAAASALCGAAWSPEILVASRAIQGVAAAMLSPAALAILLATYRDEPGRSRALAAWASLIGLGAATGLLLGGAITEALSWRWIFFINLPVAAIALVVVPRVVPPDDLRGVRTAPNLVGALLGTLALLLLVFTVVETEGAGWTSARTLGGFAGVVLLAVAFVASERRAATPRLPPALLRRRQAMVADGLVLLAAGGLMAMFFFQTLFMQRVLGYGALQTGAAFLPFSVGMGVASFVAGRLPARLDPRWPVAGGLLAGAAGLLWMGALAPDSPYVGHLAPTMALTGYGMGTAFVVVMAIATGGAEERDGGLASALLTTGQQIGGAIGIAVMVTVATDRTTERLAGGAPPPLAFTDGFTLAFTAQAAILAVAAGLAVVLLRAARDEVPVDASRPAVPGTARTARG